MNRDRQGFFGVVLPDALKIELPFYLRGFGNVDAGFVLPILAGQLFVEHLLAQYDAVITNVNAWAGDQLLDLRVGFAAKTAEGDIGRPGHSVYSFLSAKLVAFSTSPGISLRDW